MSQLLSKYQEKQRQLQQLAEELENMKNNERFKEELAFKEKLEALMQEFNKEAKDVVTMLAPEREATSSVAAASASAPKNGRAKRKLKVYKNPHTGEMVETRGGNHKTLKQWKEEYGTDTVESWLVQ